MNKKLLARLGLDLIMTILLISVMGYYQTGASLHEILGICAIVLMLIHLCLGSKWLVGVIKQREKKDVPVKIMVSLAVNIILSILLLVMLVTSVGISTTIFSLSLSENLYSFFSYIHGVDAYLILIFTGIHLGLHWKMIIAFVKKGFHFQNKFKPFSVISAVAALLVMAFGVKSSFEHSLVDCMFEKQTGSDDGENVVEVASAVYTAHGGRGGKNENVQMDFSSYTIEDGDSVEDFLGKFTCPGCSKHCSLISPQCMTGQNYALEAKVYYEEYTGNKATTNDSSTDKTTVEENTAVGETAPTLSAYLSNLRCDGCSRHCSLFSPGCTTGANKASEATSEYYSLYGSSSSSESGSTTKKEDATINISVDRDSFLETFGEYASIMGMWVGLTYYTVKFSQKND